MKGQMRDTSEEGLKKRMALRLSQLEGWTLQRLADETGEGYKNVQRWVSGAVTVPAHFITRYAAVVPVDPVWLLTGDGTADPEDCGGGTETPAPMNGGTGGIGEGERLDLLRLLSFVQQVVASGPVGSTELVEDLKALASVLHVVQLERQLPGGDQPPEE